MTTRSRLGSVLLYVVGLAVIGGAAVGAWRMSRDKDSALAASRAALSDSQARGPVVQVAQVTASPKERQITLLGRYAAYQTVTLYSKVSGYVSRLSVDRGDRVKQGDVVAIISSVETDQQFEVITARPGEQEAQLDPLPGPGWPWLGVEAGGGPGGNRLHHGAGQRGANGNDEVL